MGQDRKKVMIVFPDEDRREGDPHLEKCATYAIEIMRQFSENQLPFESVPFPSCRSRLCEESPGYVALFCHGNDTALDRHDRCSHTSGDSKCACICVGPEALDRLKAEEVQDCTALTNAGVMAATCCFSAGHFGQSVVDKGNAIFFIGYRKEFEHADMRELFDADMDLDRNPFFLVVRMGVRRLVEGNRLVDLIDQMMELYLGLMRVCSDSRLPLFSRSLLWLSLFNNLQAIHAISRGGPATA
jgi:hypothetical protein